MRAVSGPPIFLTAYLILCTLLVQYRSAAIKHTGKCRLLLSQAQGHRKLRESQALGCTGLEAQEDGWTMNRISFLISRLMVSD